MATCIMAPPSRSAQRTEAQAPSEARTRRRAAHQCGMRVCVCARLRRLTVDDMCVDQWRWASKYPQGYETAK